MKFLFQESKQKIKETGEKEKRNYCYLHKAEKQDIGSIVTSTKQRSRREEVLLPLQSKEVGERKYCYLYKAEKQEGGSIVTSTKQRSRREEVLLPLKAEKQERESIVTSTKQRSRREKVLLPLQSREVGGRKHCYLYKAEKQERGCTSLIKYLKKMNSPCCTHWYSTQEKEEAGSNYDIYTLPTLKKKILNK